MNFELRKTRDFGELITDTFTFVQLTWKPLLKCFAVICGFFVLGAIVSDVLFHVRYGSVTPKEGRAFGYGLEDLFSVESFVLIFFSNFQYFVLSLMSLCFVSVYHEKKRAPAVEEVWGYFKYYFFRFLLACLLLLILQVIAFICCFAPGVWLYPIINLMLAVMVLENATLGYSFTRAFFLIKNHWWQTAGAVLIMVIIVYLGLGFTSIPALFFTIANGFSDSSNSFSIVLAVLFSVIQHVCTVVLVLPWILIALVNFSLAEEKEGAGLASRIESIGTARQADLPEEEY